MRLSLLCTIVLLTLAGSSHAGAQRVFTADEHARILAFWAAPNRYECAVPERNGLEPWQVRLTPEGSAWLLRFQQTGGGGKAPPTADPLAQAGAVTWKEWVQRRMAYDRWLAQRTADRLNAADLRAFLVLSGQAKAELASKTANHAMMPEPANPGMIPPDLLAAVGNPPAFAEAVIPLQHKVTFDEGDVYTYQDHTNVRPTYAYYRFPQGVATGGSPLTDAERTSLFDAAGLTDSEKRVMMAISKLEGSFDAVNTYDTGYVSIGFIQFITFDDGRHSLAQVLNHEKTDAPADFERDFRRFGIDLNADHVLTVVDTSTGAELTGTDAVHKVIDDKRLIAVFQKAGKTSTPFRIAQIRVAKEAYWPADEPICVTVNGRSLSCKLSDIIKSEAGMAAFFDRKVNRGNVLPLPDVVMQTMLRHNITQLSDVSKYEKEIVAACKYRVDFLSDSALTQPDPIPQQ